MARMAEIWPFQFATERRLVALTGVRASNLPELLEGLETVPGASIFFHTHHQYLAHHFQKPVYYNDFALWVSEALQEDALAEQIASADMLTFTSIRELREAIAGTVRKFLEKNDARRRECPPGDEFHFCRSKSFILETGFVARSIPEFFSIIPHISTVSLYFHFFESRLRLEHPVNDFSRWLDCCGRADLARAIDKLDPYLMTLEELRDAIREIGREETGRT
jgi:hypothetical protein